MILAKLQTGEVGLAGFAVLLRAAYHAFSLGAAGLGFFSLLFGARLRVEDAGRLRRWRVLGAGLGLLAGLATTTAHVTMLAENGTPIDPEAWRVMVASHAGAAYGVAGTGLLLLSLSGLRGGTRLATAVGGLLICASYLLMGHSTQLTPRLPVAALLFVHLVLVAFWLGSLPALVLVLRGAPCAADLVQRWSRMAMVAVPVLGVAGLALAWSVLGGPRSLVASPYGLALLAKLAGVVLLIGFAAWNRYRLTPALFAAPEDAAPRLARSITAEAVVALVVLYTAAEMTSTSPPGFPHHMH